jgi:hypothetical protein
LLSLVTLILETCRHGFLKLRTWAELIGSWQMESACVFPEAGPRGSCIKLRNIERYACTPNSRVCAAREHKEQVYCLFQAWSQIVVEPHYFVATQFVTKNDDIRLGTM